MIKADQPLKDVHTEHCCIVHGCKYGSRDCTVYYGGAAQSYRCEDCSDSAKVDDICGYLVPDPTMTDGMVYNVSEREQAAEMAISLAVPLVVLTAAHVIPLDELLREAE